MATKNKDTTLVEGPIWVAANGAVWQETPTVTADDVRTLRENYYWASVREALKTLVYRDRYTIEVLGPDLIADEERTTAITRMADRADLWSKVCTVLPDWIDWGVAPWNPVWGGAGTTADPYELKQVRRVDPYSLRWKPMAAGVGWVYNEILPGIAYNPTAGEVEVWATDATGYSTKRLANVALLLDPTVPDLGGKPMIRPVISLIRMLDFAWGAQMQQVNRIGAPILFIRMAVWDLDSIEYAEKVLRNWGKDTQYPLRPGMEPIGIPVKEGSVAKDVIEALAGMVIDYFSPAKMIAKSGTLIGGSAAPELDVTYAFVAGLHRRLEANIERLLQPWCGGNGHDGYTVRVHIPSPSIDRAELNLKLANELRQSGLGDPVQYLALLGQEGYSTEEIEAFAAWNKEHGMTAPTGFGFAESRRALGYPDSTTLPYGDAITNARAETDAEAHHEAIAARTTLKMDEVLSTLKKGAAGLVGDA